jgi:hypothetical protein
VPISGVSYYTLLHDITQRLPPIIMFRDSDYLAPLLHPTYAKKPPSEFQLRGQIAEFDDSGRKAAVAQAERLYAATNATSVEAVPVTHDTVYAPKNPNADWGVSMLTLLKIYHDGNFKAVFSVFFRVLSTRILFLENTSEAVVTSVTSFKPKMELWVLLLRKNSPMLLE